MKQGEIDPAAELLRGFAVDFLTAHDASAARRIMDPAYCLSIGGHRFEGRDGSYLPVTLAQLEQFPGLVVTVHDVILGQDAIAMRFTEHGVSIRQPGRAAAWGGITLFRIEGGRLRHGWAEEDYFARKRQLKTGTCDPILPPAPAPWDQPVSTPDAATETEVRRWLESADLLNDPCIEAICVEGPSFAQVIAPASLWIDTLFTAGDRAAFHAVCHGGYAGGFDDIDPAMIGRPVALALAGMADLDARGSIAKVQLSADRLGLHRSLLDLSRTEATAR